LLLEEMFGLKKCPSTSFLIPPLKKKTPRGNKGLITNYAAVFGI
jgi:hypothetical protein